MNVVRNQITSVSQGLCKVGWTGTPGQCTACALGKYKDSAGSAACNDCEAGKYSDKAGMRKHMCVWCRGTCLHDNRN